MVARASRNAFARWTVAAAVLVAISGAIAACGGSSPSPATPTPPAGGISAVARAYLDELLGYMQSRSINRKTIDWTAFRDAVFAAAGNAQLVSDLYASAVPTALGRLGDHHSFFVAAQGTTVWNPNSRGGCSDAGAPPIQLAPGVGYVKIRSFSGTDSVGFATSIQSAIQAADGPDIAGWIVDVRGNGGGNMWPMIAGVGPVLGEGQAGAFVDPDGATTTWGYANGASVSQGSVVVRVPGAYQLQRPSPRVAVLTDCWVASSGEAVVVAFRGRPDTRSFGTPTYGLSTANQGFRLSDGGTLYLTVSTMADRNLVRYGDVIVPDEVIPDPEEAVRRAIAWLSGS